VQRAALLAVIVVIGSAATGAQMAARNTVRRFILNAYQLQDDQLIGAPAWLASETVTLRLDLDNPSPDGIRQSVRKVLADRFNLRAHIEQREMPVYALTPSPPGARPGPGLKVVAPEECPAALPRGFPDQAAPPPCGTVRLDEGQLLARAATMEAFVAMVNTIAPMTGLDRPVIDRSGFSATYAFALRFAPAGRTAQSSPAFAAALQQEFGLTLQPQQAAREVLVIDSIERPAQN
jgi:uncharacterized protein (TIGR03435 family)